MAQQLIYGSEFIEDFAAQTNVPLPPPNYARLYYNGTTLVCYDSAGNQLIGSGGGGGTVTSVLGTANQIVSDGSTTTPTLSIANPFTFPGTVTNNLSIFGATTSAQFASICSDETGTGALVFAGSPALTGTTTAINIAATGTITGVSGTFTDTTAGNVGVAAVNSTAATLTQAQSSTKVNIVGQYWTGAASAADTWSIQTVLTNGTNGDSILTFTHTGSTGSGLGTSFPGNVTIANNKTLNLQGATGNLNIGNALAGLQWSGCGSLVGSATSGLMVFKDNAATGYNRLCFGGTTSAFPALKRSTTSLTLRLADDSADGPFGASTFTASAVAPTVSAGQVGYGATTASTVGAAGGASTLPITPTGYLIVNIAGTAFKIPYYAS